MSFVISLVILLLIAACVIYAVMIYNSLVDLKNNVDKAWANIDVLLKERHDELPKLIDTCKGYMQYEQRTFEMITQARTAYQSASSVQEKAQAEQTLTGALKTLFAVAENYPELKANNDFMQLQQRITEIEERIADRREFFNDSVNTYNIRIQQAPEAMIAGMMHLEPHDLFKAAEADRQDVQVNFA